MSVTITTLEAENVKRIKAVQIIPAPTGLTLVGGNNNQGKTSVLDALAWALGGEKFRQAPRDGSMAPPHLKVTLSNGIVVERKGKNSTLTVTDPTGHRAGQQLLHEFVEVLALDLPSFMQASDKEKADTLLKIIGVGEELTQLDRRIKALYDKRTTVGQIANQKKAVAEEMQEYPEAPAEPVSAMELIQQQQEILARNGENQRKRQHLAELEDRERQLSRQVQDLSRELEYAEHQLSKVQQDVQDARKTAAQLQDESTEALQAAILAVDETNRKVRANLDKARAVEDAAEFVAQYTTLTEQLQEARRKRTTLLEGAELPLPGLSVEDGRLTYHGHPWGAMSGSDQLRVATAIVRRLNPNCGFVLLDKLEQMDLQTLSEFGAWLQTEGLQAIATRVSTGGECQIIIEDGRVRGQDTDARLAAAPRQWTKGAF